MLKIDKQLIETLLDGYWYQAPSENWNAEQVVINQGAAIKGKSIFVAIDYETWIKGTQNTGVYAKWSDTHDVVPLYPNLFKGVIARKPIEGLPKDVAQFIVPNTFEIIDKLSKFVRPKLSSKVISVTGTVGKSSTKEYLNKLLSHFGSVYSTIGNHNTRTGVKLTLSNAMHDPDYLVVETALSALYMKSGSISRLAQPNIAVITEIGVGQKGLDELKTAEFKSRIAEGIVENGIIVLNRDIRVFDELSTYCKRYSDRIITYGRHSEADIKILNSAQNLVLDINKQHYMFALPDVDEGTKHNLTAALTVCHLLNLDLTEVQNVFQNLEKKKSVLELLSAKSRHINVIDDTYNAEHLSMINAFEYCNEKFSDRRKLLIVGDIINLEDKSIAVHEGLAEPIEENGFERIATFGEFTQYLNKKLPQEKIIGHFNDVEACVEAVLKHVKENDVILVKGSRRNSTIHHIPQRLLKSIDHVDSEAYIKNFKYRFSFDDPKNKLLDQKTHFGIGGLILIYMVLKKISLKELLLKQTYSVSKLVGREGQRPLALGLGDNETYTLFELLQFVINTQKADAILALAELAFKTTNQALVEIKKQAELFGIDPNTVLNVTGRNIQDNVQEKSLKSVFIVAEKIKQLPRVTLDLLRIPYVVFKGELIESPALFSKVLKNLDTIIIGSGEDKTYICFDHNYVGIFHYQKSTINKEYEIPYIMTNGHNTNVSAKPIKQHSRYINILGDSYFGEFYTRIRKKRGVNDALQQYGYNHSFEGLASFFRPEDINMVNLEASFTTTQHSDLKIVKPFILDAESKPTLKELKRRNIHYVNLANNHAKDFGNSGLEYTLEQLSTHGVQYIGAGLNQYEANQYFEVNYNDKIYAIFNGYWHRDPAYQIFDFYALGNRGGVSCLTGLLNPIEQYKKLNPDHYVIVIAHWGIDFKQVSPGQQSIASTLVDRGVDLIIGHGAHTLQPISCYKNKAVIYSLGNGVFNSNGEFDRYQALPYGLLTRLDLEVQSLKLYPFYTNNKETFWQPHVVNETDFNEVVEYFSKQKNVYPFTLGQDKQGYYLEMEIFK